MQHFFQYIVKIRQQWFYKLLLLLFIICTFNIAKAQQYNLVPNPSFEQYNFCPVEYSAYTGYNSKPDIWYKPDTRGATYFNACANGFSFNYNGMPLNFFGGGIQLPAGENWEWVYCYVLL